MTNMAILLAAGLFTSTEIRVIEKVAKEYRLSEEQTRLLFAIRKTENGDTGLEFGIGQNIENHPAKRYKNNPTRSLITQARWCSGTIRKRWNGDLNEFAHIYCPMNAEVWQANVRHWMHRLEAQ